MPVDFSHFVFVDFENVQEIDLGLVAGKPVQVTLLIGKKQTRIDLTLVRQIHQLAGQVNLVDVGASGRNALDLTLACYLGRAVERFPQAGFFIVSRDKDFEAMIDHLRQHGVNVARHESFPALPFLAKARKPVAAKEAAPAKGGAHGRVAAATRPAAPDERLDKLLTRLRNHTAPRPKKKSGLLAYINTGFGGKLDGAEQSRVLDELQRRGVLSIDPKDRVSYGPGA